MQVVLSTFEAVHVTRVEGEEGDVLLPSGGRSVHRHVIVHSFVQLTEKTQRL